MRPGSGDIKVSVLMSGEELAELKRYTYAMVEAYGLDARIERYSGKRPIGLYRWDLDCLLAVLSIALKNSHVYSSTNAPGYQALLGLQTRLDATYQHAYK